MSDKDNGAQSLPQNIGVLLFPAFEPLDVFGPIETLRMLSSSHKLNLYYISPSLEPITTEPHDPAMNSTVNPLGSAFGTRVLPTHTYDNVPEDLDVLLVPGGVGVVSFDINNTIEFIKQTYPKLKYLITVCNGAGLAAAAGILDGKKATTNKAWWKGTTAMGPKVDWVRTARYCVDGNCWTSGGVSAGIDVTLAWIAKVYGEPQARKAANMMEYEWRDDANWDPFAYVFGDSDGM